MDAEYTQNAARARPESTPSNCNGNPNQQKKQGASVNAAQGNDSGNKANNNQKKKAAKGDANAAQGKGNGNNGNNNNGNQKKQQQHTDGKGALNKQRKCHFCSSGHFSHQCNSTRLDANARREIAFRLQLCFSCLRLGHRVSDCRNKQKCRSCGRDHNSLLHTAKPSDKSPPNNEQQD